MISKKVILILLIVALILMSGCTGNNTGPSQTEKTTGGNQPSSTQEKPVPGSVQTVNFKKLIEFLPSPPTGWTAKEPQGFMYDIDSGSWSMATKDYTKGETASANVGIMDSAFNDVGWFSAWQGINNYESTEGYAKTVTVKGYPSFEIYTESNNQYVLYVNVEDRFMVYITVDDADRETMNTLANGIDYAGIAALK
jgi:hypothetical protein